MKKQTLILAGFILLTAINVSVFIINGSIKAPESSTTPLTQGTPVKTVSLTTSPSLIDLATARAATEMFWNEDSISLPVSWSFSRADILEIVSKQEFENFKLYPCMFASPKGLVKVIAVGVRPDGSEDFNTMFEFARPCPPLCIDGPTSTQTLQPANLMQLIIRNYKRY